MKKRKNVERNLSKAKTDISKFLKINQGIDASEGSELKSGGSRKEYQPDRKTMRKQKRQKLKEKRRKFHEVKQGNIKVHENLEKNNKKESKHRTTKKCKSSSKQSKPAAAVPEELEYLDDGKLIDDAEVKRLSKKLKIKPGKVPKSFYEDGDLGTLLELCELKFENEGLVDFNDKDVQKATSLGNVDQMSDDADDNSSDEIDSDLCGSDSDDEEETKSSSLKRKNPEREKVTQTKKSKTNDSEKETCINQDELKPNKRKSKATDSSDKPVSVPVEVGLSATEHTNLNNDEIMDEIKPAKFDPYAGASKFYVPPQKRQYDVTAEKVKDFDAMVLSEDFKRIYKQCVGLFNRVSESNLNTISKQLEGLYTKFGTSETNVAVSRAVMSLCCQPFHVADRLIFEKIAMIAIVHKNTQTDVSAQFTHSVCWKLIEFWQSNNNEDSEKLVADKTGVNCIKCLCYLYDFGVLSNKLVFDIIRKLLGDLCQPNIDALLAIVLNTGYNLRKNCPSDLKDIILNILKTGNEHLKSLRETSRPKLEHFLDLVTALKNNNRRKLELVVDLDALVAIQDLVSDLASRNTSDGGGTVNVSLEEISKAGANGRWWNLGTNEVNLNPINDSNDKLGHSSNENDELIELAHKCGMNTQFRESVFCAIMTSSDYMEAADKLFRMNLKKHAREIPHIVIKCLLLEEKFNPFYFHLLKSFAVYEKQNKVVLKFAIADRLKDLKMMKNKHEMSVFAELLVKLLFEDMIPSNLLSLLPIVNTTKNSVSFVRIFLKKFLLSKRTLLNSFLKRATNSNDNQYLMNLNVLTKQNIIERFQKLKDLSELKCKLLLNGKFVCEEIDNLS